MPLVFPNPPFVKESPLAVLKRYLAEFDFRHNERAALGVDDTARTVKALAGIVGKRLLYRASSVR